MNENHTQAQPRLAGGLKKRNTTTQLWKSESMNELAQAKLDKPAEVQ